MKYLIIKDNKLINKNKSEEINNSLQFLNDLCIKHGSTYKGRIDNFQFSILHFQFVKKGGAL